MKRLVEYMIISGNVIEKKRSYMPLRSALAVPLTRAPRVAGSSSEKKLKANELSSEREAARVINCNYARGDVHMILHYDNEHLPDRYEGAEAKIKAYFGKLRYEAKKQGIEIKRFWVTANWSPKRNAPVRLHHHLVLNREALELAQSLWIFGSFSVELLDNRKDHSDLAAYLVRNVHGRPAKKKWHCSRNMDRPIYTEPVEVDDVEDIKPEKGSVIKAHESSTDEDGNIISTYLRCVVPMAPKVRGGKVIRPREEKKGGKQRDKRHK